MCLRQKVFDLAREEGCPYEQNLLNKRMFHVMFTGLSNTNIRIDLRERCKNNINISDTKLLKLVSKVVANETERNEKFNKNKPIVNAVEVPKKNEPNLNNKKRRTH